MAWWIEIKEHYVMNLQRCCLLPHYDLERSPFMWGVWFHPPPIEFKYKQPFHYENPHLKIRHPTGPLRVLSLVSPNTLCECIHKPTKGPVHMQGPLLKTANDCKCRLSGKGGFFLDRSCYFVWGACPKMSSQKFLSVFCLHFQTLQYLRKKVISFCSVVCKSSKWWERDLLCWCVDNENSF